MVVGCSLTAETFLIRVAFFFYAFNGIGVLWR
jgi:hypothetical protein